MSNKNDTFNIDDLLNIPNLANEFDKTNELNFDSDAKDSENISNEEISIDSLINDNCNGNIVKTKLLEIEESINDNCIRNTPPPPPPIIKKEEINTNNNQVHFEEPSITSAIDLDDFDFEYIKEEDANDEFNELDEKIEEIIDNQTMNDYYKNIEEEQDIKKTNEYTRIYFDDEIEHHLKNEEVDDNKAVMDETNVEHYDSNSIGVEGLAEQKNTYFKKLRAKSKDFKENLSSVAQYYRFEYKYSKVTWYVSIFLNICSIVAFSLGSYAIFGLGMSTWLYLPIVLFSIVCLCFFVMSTIKTKSMKKELKNNGYQLSKENATATITSVYKKLITSNYYLNWGAAALYVVSGLLILMTFIVCYFINLADRDAPMPVFGDLIINRGTNNSPLIVVWTFASLCFSMMLLQLIYNPLNIYRRNQIEVFYGKTLISEEMIEKYRKSANRKGIAIFVVSTAVISLVVLIVYFVMKKRTKRAIV